MSREVVIISPAIAPGSGGLADYTLRVVQEWEGQTPVRFIVPASHDAQSLTASNPAVATIERSRASLRAQLPGPDGKVLLQYSAYGFDHHGYPRWLLRELVSWKAATGGKLVVMLHEIWTFWPVLNKNYLIQQLHRRELRTLVACADAVFTSTASQAEHLKELQPGAVIEVLPVGTNITPPATEASRVPGLAVLFGLPGARLRALRAMGAELKALAAARRLTRLVTIGTGNTGDEREEKEILRTLSFSEGTEQLGALPEAEISHLLARASFGLSAQDALSLTKSGTFMAYAAHDLNILSALGARDAAEPLCWLVHPEELRRGLSEQELQARAEHLRAWQQRTAAWPMIADRFAHALQINQPAGAMLL